MNINKLNKYVSQVMRNFPNVDGVIITDTDAIVRYYFPPMRELPKLLETRYLASTL